MRVSPDNGDGLADTPGDTDRALSEMKGALRGEKESISDEKEALSDIDGGISDEK
jgi:hypothetical protein